MDPMANLIGELPQPPQQNDMGGVMQQQPNMFSGMQQQPVAPQAPQMPQYPQAPAPAAPTWQQPVPQPPAAPQFGQPQLPQYGQPQVPQYGLPQQQPAPQPGQQPQGQQPGQVPNEYPLIPQVPQIPGMPMAMPGVGDQQPEWAQQLIDTVKQMQQQPNGPGEQAWDANNRPRNWGEMYQAMTQMADKKAEEKVQAFVTQQQQAAEQQRQQDAQANAQIDQAIGMLRMNQMLPPVMNPNDPNDPGRAAEQELIAYTLSMGGQTAQSLLAAAPALKAHHDSGLFFDKGRRTLIRRGSQTAAASAPIAGGMPTVGQYTQQAGPTQSQLAMASRDLGSLMNMGMQAVQ